MSKATRLDEIGYWSEIKLDIVRDYATAYSRILSAQRHPSLYHVYIDGFAGAGIHISRTSGEFVPGSPLNALAVDPPFREYHLIDLDASRAGSLRRLTADRREVHVHDGDCNRILISDVFPRVRFKDFRRALCVLDPYGLHLSWSVVRAAGASKTIELFLNFPVMDMNMNVLWHNREAVDSSQAERMTFFWGDESWKQAAYSSERNLFGFEEKTHITDVARAYEERLRSLAGFAHVASPLAMRNSKGAIVYFLFFASPKPVARRIVEDILDKYRPRMA